MFDEIYCGRCGEDVPIEKTEYSTTYFDDKIYVTLEAIGRCPECGEVVGDRHFFEYSRSESMSKKEIEIFRNKILTRPAKYDII